MEEEIAANRAQNTKDDMSGGPPAEAENLSGLSVRNIDKRFEDVEAIKNVSLSVHEGKFFTLLGPSGCGKTTLLRIIAGLELPDAGQVILGGQDITSLPATKRQVNTVFQSYALFPHLSIFENVAFGLRSRKVPQNEVESRVNRRLEMLGLEEMATRFPHQLSGGQQQRVALARALVNEPQVLLLDEPMSALDAKLRAQVQVELRRLQRKLGQTFILVTHDQAEALVVSDQIAVMNQAEIVQFGSPKEVYEHPRTCFVAEFLGAANLIEGTKQNDRIETDLGTFQLESSPTWNRGTVAIRPERIQIVPQPPERNGVKATVREAIYRGTNVDLWLEPGPLRTRTAAHRNYEPGEEVWLELPPEGLVILDE
ncbi:Spermidine/putrescine import ABC transporter ATP-binding protein PotA (TC 3.A.1.11.1) [Olavius sp. associated proteobacterium Delta 1]|nr:Spermidine/putrescine import ABC transporter ATP-binding protein PotA (TC 3.A.1.11.1) [Olavius sp. associated proteobacterium Delta 1]